METTIQDEKLGDVDPPGWPPANRAILCVRIILWFLPLGFVCLSAVGMFWWNEMSLVYPDMGILEFRLGSYLFANVIFILGTGWYLAFLSSGRRENSKALVGPILRFFVLQVLGILTILTATLVYLFLTRPFHIKC